MHTRCMQFSGREKENDEEKTKASRYKTEIV